MNRPVCSHRSIVESCPQGCGDPPGHIHWRCSEGCDDPAGALAEAEAGARFGALQAMAARATSGCGHAECTDFCHRRYSGELW